MNITDRLNAMRAIYTTANPKVKDRATNLLGNVSDITFEGEDHQYLCARVTSATDPEAGYDVRINLKHRLRRCSCPAHHNYRNTPCKHTVAVVIATGRILKGAVSDD